MKEKTRKIISLAVVFAMVFTMFANFNLVRAEEDDGINFRVEGKTVKFDLPDGLNDSYRVTLTTLDGETLVNRYTPRKSYGYDYSVISMLKSGASRGDLAKGKIPEEGTGKYIYTVEMFEKGNTTDAVASFDKFISYTNYDGDKLEVIEPVISYGDIEVTVEKPEAGVENKEEVVDMGGYDYTTGSSHPEVSLNNSNFDVYAEWINGENAKDEEDYYDIYTGTFEEGKAYYAVIELYAKEGYFMFDDTNINLNGATYEDTPTIAENEYVSLIVKVHCGEEPEYIKGDLDGNGVVDANDASIALELNKTEKWTQEDILVGDMDDNNVIDANDASLILEVYKLNN